MQRKTLKEGIIMNTKLFNLNLVKYELRNLVGNFMTIFFGVFFPIVLSILIGTITTKDVPDSIKSTIVSQVFITCSIIIPLATIFIGYPALFSQELEKDIPTRLQLFGYNQKSILIAKITANLIVVTLSLGLYTLVDSLVLDIKIPTLKALIISLISIYLLTLALFIAAHGISLYFKKFSITFGVTMTIYFAIMILSGVFGVQPDDFPKLLRSIAYLLPTTYMSCDFLDFWTGGSYNFVPYIQSFIFFIAICGVILFIGINHSKRKVK